MILVFFALAPPPPSQSTIFDSTNGVIVRKLVDLS